MEHDLVQFKKSVRSIEWSYKAFLSLVQFSVRNFVIYENVKVWFNFCQMFPVYALQQKIGITFKIDDKMIIWQPIREEFYHHWK